MKVIVGLGNPGAEYDDSRHNVGWWVLDRLAYDWNLDGFEKTLRALVTEGSVDDESVRLVKPTTFMNRSGAALVSLRLLTDFDVGRDLLGVVEDAALGVGRVRFRRGGGAGGHNGLKSVSGSLGTESYGRLRVGVGVAPPDVDLADWVLADMPPEDEDVVAGLLPGLTEGVEVWMREGVEEAMNRFNR